MSAMNSNTEQPRASTSKEEAAERRVSTATAYLPTTQPIHPAELRRHFVVPPQQRACDSGYFVASASSLAKLQTYLPTGTWVTYTALQTWAFSLRPNDPPTSSMSNCNAHQRIALFIVLALSAFIAFSSSFVKRFIYDAQRTHVLYPPPDLFNVPRRITDSVTGVQFPCRTREKRYCWPLVGDAGELVYDEATARLRVIVFRAGVQVQVKRRIWCRRIWRSCFVRTEDVPDAPMLCTSPHLKHVSVASTFGSGCTTGLLEIDNIVATAPALEPRWTRTLMGVLGGKAYLDLRPRVWGHALVSVLAFLTLALFSTQVCGCLYPEIPDYLPSTLQTGMLVLLGFIAAVFVKDDAVSLGQAQPATVHPVSGAEEEVPEHLKAVAEMLVWVGRQDFGLREKQ